MKDLMKFEKFTKEVVDKVKEFLPESFKDADVSLQLVKKNNGLELTGLTIRSLNSNVSPTIYLERYYEDYASGEELSNVLSRIASVRVEHEVSDFDTDLVTNYETAKEKIVPRLINAELNQDTLKNRPHKLIADLAVIYTVLLDNDFKSTASVTVTNDIMRMWNVSVDVLHEAAVSNLATVTPSVFRVMSEVISEMMNISADELEMMGMSSSNEQMYVLSNSQKMHGASALLDKDMMERIKDKVGDYFILPSSTHEVLIVPVRTGIGVNELKAMVSEVNETQVAIEDRLSNSVYVYIPSKGLKVV